MEEKIVTSENAGKTVSRRTVAKGIAWGVPAITMLGATPAFAATNTPFAFTNLTPAVINAANSTANLTASGTGPDGATITVTLPGFTGTDRVVDGEWSVEIPSGDVPQGYNVQVTASLSADESATKTYTKDIVAPAPTITRVTYNKNANTLTVEGTLGSATGDSTSGTLNATIKRVSTTHTVSGTPWTQTFSSVNPQEAYSFSVTQTDGAGNSTTSEATSGTTPAN